MPTIGIPHTVGNSYSRSTGDDSASASIKLRLTVAARRDALTQMLAEGTNPTSSPELALRASQLTGDRRRSDMVRTWRRILNEARRPSVTRALGSIVNRRAVLEAQDAIEAMIARLGSPEAIEVKGMAMAERIVTDGLASPLYDHAEPGSLRRLVLLATAQLDGHPSELPIAA